MKCKKCGHTLNMFTAELDATFKGWYCSNCNPYKPKEFIMSMIGINKKETQDLTIKLVKYLSLLLGIITILLGLEILKMTSIGYTYILLGTIVVISVLPDLHKHK